MANPPFTGSVFQEEISKDLLALAKTKKSELLFVALFTKMLEVGGRCASIVPDGVLFGSSTAHKAVRKELVENQKLEAVIAETFPPTSEILSEIESLSRDFESALKELKRSVVSG